MAPLQYHPHYKQRWQPYVPIYLSSYPHAKQHLQIANRPQAHPPNPVGLGDAFSRASMGDHRAHSFPQAARGGSPNKRLRPGFKLSDINGSPPPGLGVGGGAAGAGLGAGRPSLADPVPRRPPSNFGSPFSNFGKIV